MNLQRFPRYPLTFGPTPIQPLKRLSDHLGGNRLGRLLELARQMKRHGNGELAEGRLLRLLQRARGLDAVAGKHLAPNLFGNLLLDQMEHFLPVCRRGRASRTI